MTQIIDTNVLVRFLTKDHSSLSLRAKKIFEMAQSGKTKIYLDEVVLAETVWVLLSRYHYPKGEICQYLINILSNSWIANPRKVVLLQALTLYSEKNLSFVDCWLHSLANETGYPLATFDQRLKKLVL